MARPPVDKSKELITFPVRLPRPVVDRLISEAKAAGVTRSDVLRQYISDEQVKPLAKPVPAKTRSRRKVERSPLEFEINAIGVNMNQIATCCNAHINNGGTIDVVDVLDKLNQVKNKIDRLARNVNKSP